MRAEPKPDEPFLRLSFSFIICTKHKQDLNRVFLSDHQYFIPDCPRPAAGNDQIIEGRGNGTKMTGLGSWRPFYASHVTSLTFCLWGPEVKIVVDISALLFTIQV